MRVRMNFTVDFDLDDYRNGTGQDGMTKTEVRSQLQEAVSTMTMDFLKDRGVPATSLGRNNAYDAESRQTIHEEYVNA